MAFMLAPIDSKLIHYDITVSGAVARSFHSFSARVSSTQNISLKREPSRSFVHKAGEIKFLVSSGKIAIFQNFLKSWSRIIGMPTIRDFSRCSPISYNIHSHTKFSREEFGS